jgi:hypothetical protein
MSRPRAHRGRGHQRVVARVNVDILTLDVHDARLPQENQSTKPHNGVKGWSVAASQAMFP